MDSVRISFLLLLIVASLHPCRGRIQRVVFGVNHKTGTELCNRLMKAIRATPCASGQIHVFLDHHFGRKPSKTGKILLMNRNPFHLIVSGYLYHRRGSEEWTRAEIPFYRKDIQGHHLLPMRADMVGIPSPQKGESYMQYLQRLPTEEGIAAEVIRCQHREFEHMRRNADTRQTAQSGNVLGFCLGDFMRTQEEFLRHMDSIFRFLGLDMDCAQELHAIMDTEGPTGFHPHGTRNETQDRTALVDLARQADMRYFNGLVAQLEQQVRCENE
jgi:hypothetical protein